MSNASSAIKCVAEYDSDMDAFLLSVILENGKQYEYGYFKDEGAVDLFNDAAKKAIAEARKLLVN